MFRKKKTKKNVLKPAGLVSIISPKSVVSEQFKIVRTNLEFSIIDRDLKSLVVTSISPGAGKSTISANLAVTFASQDKRVLLVDADLRKPMIHKIFNYKNNHGLSTLIKKKDLELQDFIYHSEYEEISILTSGVIPPNPAELLSSGRMLQLIEEMKQTFDIIIFDTPPMLTVADAQILSGKVDGLLFVLRKGIDSKEQILKAKKRSESANANVLGAVYNRIEPNNKDYYYEYIE